MSGGAHRVAALAFPGLAPFELAVAAEVFALPRPELGVAWWYAFSVCAERSGPMPAVGGFDIVVHDDLATLVRADTVIVSGTPDVHGEPSPPVIRALREAHARGARIVSICSGAFTLAATGLLDGLEVATHWRYARLLQHRYPRLRVDAGILYSDHGRIVTSAGTAAGIDACLHLVRRDHGAHVANQVARRMVVPAHRSGGQAQFIETPLPPRLDDDPIGTATAWALEHLAGRISVADLAARAHLSPRQFSRRFTAAMGISPTQWLLTQRIHASLPLLEQSDDGVEAVGQRVGFNSPAAYRRHFHRLLGVAPAAYRHNFRRTPAAIRGARGSGSAPVDPAGVALGDHRQR